jgi:hypothetical protein
MATNTSFDWRRSDRRLYALVAILFPLIVLIGFGRTYYLKMLVGTPPLPSILVHVHGIVMTAWVLFFIAQVWLIRTKRAKVHMKMGLLGVGLAILLVFVGFFTGAAAAKYGSPSIPPQMSPLAFFVVPVFDLLIFVGLFGAVIYYRRNPANHKRLMLLTVLNFLPPAIGRIPLSFIASAGPLFFFGIPTVIAIVLITYDTWRNRKLNPAFLIGAVVLIASYPTRIVLSGTGAWLAFASWVTGWAA